MANKNRSNEKSSGSSNSSNKSRQPGGWQQNYFWVLLAILLLFWIFSSQQGGFFGGPSSVNYSTFRQQLDKGNVERVEIEGYKVTGSFKQQVTVQASREDTLRTTKFVTHIPRFGDTKLMPKLEAQNVEVKTIPPSDFSWWSILIWIIPLAFLVFIGIQFFQRMQMQGKNLFNIGQSKAKLQDAETVDTTFDDVAGLKSAKTELREITSFLKNPDQFDALGGEIPRGVLLVGPPGTGKTLLARAVSGEAGVPFFTITGSDFMEMFVGVGAKRVRDMFKKAKEKSPSIIFIDELDSIGRKRGAGIGGGHDEREQTLNQMLSELDGFEPNEGVVVMAATNRPDILDKALLRPGRFDRQITVNLPPKEHRKEILEIHATNKKLSDDVDLEEIARSTPGFSGADLSNLLNESALLAARHKRNTILQKDIDQARDKVMMGLKREGINLSEDEKELLAYHEAGHAVVAAVLPNADPIHKVTIIPRGQAMGVTQQLPEKEKLLYEKEYMLDRMAVMMGGRAAEIYIFDTATSGAANDLKQLTKLARKMVLDWGMSDRFDNMAFGGQQEQVFLGEQIGNQTDYSDSTAREIDEEVHRIVSEAFDKALSTLQKYDSVLKKLAQELLNQEEVEGAKVMEWLNDDADEVNKNNESEDTEKKHGEEE